MMQWERTQMPKSNEINEIKTDIALIKKDIFQITQMYKKIDNTLDQLTVITKTLAVQEKTLENDSRRISTLEENDSRRIDTLEENFLSFTRDRSDFRKDLHKKLEEMTVKMDLDRDNKHKQMLSVIDALSATVNKKIEDHEKRITSLEGWKWYVAGIAAVVIIIFNKIPWATIFGS